MPVTVVVMARDNRVRLSDEELAQVDKTAEELYGEGAAEDMPRGRVIGAACKRVLNEDDTNE